MLLPPSAGDRPALIPVGGDQLEGDPQHLPQDAVIFPDHPAGAMELGTRVGVGVGVRVGVGVGVGVGLTGSMGAGTGVGAGAGVEFPLLPASATPRPPMRSMAGRLTATGELLRTGQGLGLEQEHDHHHHHHNHNHHHHNNHHNNR